MSKYDSSVGDTSRHKVLLFSPVRLDPETLALALRSHRELIHRNFELHRMYFDDNIDPESSRLLSEDLLAEVISYTADLPKGSGDDSSRRVVAMKDRAIEIFLKSDYTHLFLVDSDAILDPHKLEELLQMNKSIIPEVFCRSDLKSMSIS